MKKQFIIFCLFGIFLQNISIADNLFKQEYINAQKYCSKQELRSSTEIALCHYVQLNKKSYGKKYLKIREDCYSLNKTTSDIQQCVEEKICQD